MRSDLFRAVYQVGYTSFDRIVLREKYDNELHDKPATNDAKDRNKERDSDGFTNLEEYINCLAANPK